MSRRYSFARFAFAMKRSESGDLRTTIMDIRLLYYCKCTYNYPFCTIVCMYIKCANAKLLPENKMAQAQQSDLESHREDTLSVANTSTTYEYKHDRILGHGAFGVVSLVKRSDSGEQFAMKSVCNVPNEYTAALRLEAQALAALRHPNIVQFVEVYVPPAGDSAKVCVIMEYCEGGDLNHYIDDCTTVRGRRIPEELVFLWLEQLANALVVSVPLDRCCYRRQLSASITTCVVPTREPCASPGHQAGEYSAKAGCAGREARGFRSCTLHRVF
jgi:hypothetical protein